LIGTSWLYVRGNWDDNNDDDDDKDKEEDGDDVMSMGELQDEAELKSKMKNMRSRGNNVEFAFRTISFRFCLNFCASVQARPLAFRVFYILADIVAHFFAIHCFVIPEHESQECFQSLPKRITPTGGGGCIYSSHERMGHQVWSDRAREECKKRHE
jgi:hypothetical protein